MVLTISTLISDINLKQNISPLEVESITVVVNFNDGRGETYFGGQVLLTAKDDNISLQTTTEALKDLAIVKAKKLIADAQVVVPEPAPEYIPDEEPAQSETPAN